MILGSGQWTADYNAVLRYIGGFFAPMQAASVPVDPERLTTVVTSARKFPEPPGLEDANAFKKAAWFIVNFVSERPILVGLPEDLYGKSFEDPKIANAAIALMFAIDSLEGATVTWHDGTERELCKRIEVSSHSFIDIAAALSGTSMSIGFELVAVLLEQMAYKTNPHCQYPI